MIKFSIMYNNTPSRRRGGRSAQVMNCTHAEASKKAHYVGSILGKKESLYACTCFSVRLK